MAKDGVEAIDFLNGEGIWSEPAHPTLILLGLDLPRKNGRQVLAVIKGDDLLRRIPVVTESALKGPAWQHERRRIVYSSSVRPGPESP